MDSLDRPSHILGRLRGPNGFTLARDEYFCRCPYDEVHIVTNKRFGTHLLKCRRNYIRKLEGAGEVVRYDICRFNPDHQMLPPEYRFHDDTCSERYKRFVPPVYKVRNTLNASTMSNTEPIFLKNCKLAMPAPMTTLTSPIESCPSPSTPFASQASMPIAMMSLSRQQYNSQNSISTPSQLQDGSNELDDDGYDDGFPTISTRELHKYLENLKRSNVDLKKYEDWELESKLFPVAPYDPMEKIEVQNIAYLKPPAGLTKSERKTHYNEQRERADFIYNENDPEFKQFTLKHPMKK